GPGLRFGHRLRGGGVGLVVLVLGPGVAVLVGPGTILSVTTPRRPAVVAVVPGGGRAMCVRRPGRRQGLGAGAGQQGEEGLAHGTGGGLGDPLAELVAQALQRAAELPQAVLPVPGWGRRVVVGGHQYAPFTSKS